MSQRGHAPRHGGPAMAGEKAKNFKGSSKRLLKYLRPFWVPVIFVMLFAAASTVFSIVGPKVLALATDELANGLVRIVTGARAALTLATLARCCCCWAASTCSAPGFPTPRALSWPG